MFMVSLQIDNSYLKTPQTVARRENRESLHAKE
jgi:hypothetical protein